MIKYLYRKNGFIIFSLSFIGLLISFFFNEDGNGGGARGDFEVTYGFILALQENLLADPKDWTLIHTPLHFVLLSFVTRLVEEPSALRFLYCIFSISLPILLYLIFCNFYKDKIYRENFFILAACIFFIPSFRYTSIWASDLITSLIFFTASVFFYKKWESSNSRNLDKNILLQTFLLVLATYTRQYFAVFFIYFLYEYYKKIKLKSFLKLLGLCVISSIPVFLYTYKFPELLTGQHISIQALNYFPLGNSSIVSITLFPVIFINFLYKRIDYNKFIFSSLISLFIVFILSLNFYPNNWQGGGINFFLSQKLFNNHLYFYFTSFFTISVFIYLFLENKKNLIIILILMFMFFSFQVYQRYYDPMFFLIFFTIFKTDLTKVFFTIKNASLLLLLYFIFYYLFAVSDLIYQI